MARRRASHDGDSSSPNKVLVVFLVLFILTTLGLGGWVYSIFGERRKSDELAQKAKIAEKVAAEQEAWARLQALELRAMLGDPAFRDDKTDEHQAWKKERDEFLEPGAEVKLKEDGKFKPIAEKDKESLKAWIAAAYKDLKWNPQTYSYVTNYRDEIKKYRDEATKYRADAVQQLAKANAAEEKYRSLDDQYKKNRADQFAKISEYGKSQLKAIEEKSKSMQDAIDQNETLRKEILKVSVDSAAELKQKNALIAKYEKQLAAATGAPVPGQEKIAKGPPQGEVVPHALFLDISKGKPLWDRPRGKIIRIDEKERKVYLDRGAEEGVTVGLSFNVFGGNSDNRAEGPFKGTVEVVSVNPRTSVGRITSLYDREGNEISLNDPSPAKFQRESNNALKEGDLLFNLAWGTHVVVAGVVDWSGHGPESAAAQSEELAEFLRLVRSQGVTVDAFIDLRDGQIRGNFTPKTAFLVRGYGLPVKDKDKDAGRAKAVNDSINKLHKATLERGLFVISPDNFVHVIGYRRPRSRTDTELTGFRPTQPFGGVLLPGMKAGGEGGKVGDGALADLTGKWGGKMAGGGLLRLSFKGDGGCVWQVVLGAEKVTGYAPVVQSGKEFTVSIQGRPATLRLVSAGQTLQVTGANMDAALKRE